MSRRFRILWTFVRAFFRSKITALDESRMPVRVWPSEIDVRRLNHSLFTFYGEAARLDFMIRCRLIGWMWEEKAYTVIASVSVRYLKPVRLLQKLTVRTQLICWDEKWMYAHHVFKNENGVVAVMILKGLFTGPKGIIPTSNILKAVGLPSESPPFPDMIREWQASETAMVVGLVKTRPSSSIMAGIQ
jgi:acyl-CoA thioesterase FadM